jgi:hypothetical protein
MFNVIVVSTFAVPGTKPLLSECWLDTHQLTCLVMSFCFLIHYRSKVLTSGDLVTLLFQPAGDM